MLSFDSAAGSALGQYEANPVFWLDAIFIEEFLLKMKKCLLGVARAICQVLTTFLQWSNLLAHSGLDF